jgi:G3E family GTPase
MTVPVQMPITLVSGPLGSGKTTLLRHILISSPLRLALIINEFGELGIDGVVTVMDADALIRFPDLGRTTRMQVAAADLLLLNKVDLVAEKELEPLQAKLRELNPRAPIVPTRYGRVDPALLFGLTHSHKKAAHGDFTP